MLAGNSRSGQSAQRFPKQHFVAHGDSELLIADIASQQSISNIAVNPQVSVAFINIFTQKGYKINGIAKLISSADESFERLALPLLADIKGRFPLLRLVQIQVTEAKTIVAPAYQFDENVTEESQINEAMEAYQFHWLEE